MGLRVGDKVKVYNTESRYDGKEGTVVRVYHHVYVDLGEPVFALLYEKNLQLLDSSPFDASLRAYLLKELGNEF